MNILPSVLRDDAGMEKLARTVAENINGILPQINRAGIYFRINELDEGLLDVLASDMNIEWYNYNASIEEKRAIIQNSWNIHKHTGTKNALNSVISDVIPGTSVEEWFEYDGDPYHFRMKIPGTWTPEKKAWITKAISLVKNVRSVVDDYTFVMEWIQRLYVGCALYTCGRTTYNVPAVIIEDDWYIDENSDMLLDENGILLIVE